LNLGYFFNVFNEEFKALLHKPVDLEEVSADENGHGILDVEFWTIVLFYRRLLGIRLSTFGHRKLPSASTSTDALQSLIALLFLLEFLHRKNIVEQPLEYDRITMNADIDFVLI